MMGMPTGQDWVLIGGYNDKSFIRNTLMYKLFNEMGHYASHTKHCEVFLNGEYIGLYIFMEKIRRASNRLPITKMLATDTTGDNLTGGYIFRHDYIIDTTGWNSQVGPPDCPSNVANYQYEYPSENNIQPTQKNYLQQFVDTFEQRIFSPEFADPKKGYRPLCDIPSFADYLICNEFAWNGDGFAKSFFMHKDRDSKDGKLHAGPIWDFDWALKRMPWTNPADMSGWSYTTYPCNNLQATLPWHSVMMTDTFFQNSVRCQWEEFRKTILNKTSIYHYIDSMAAYLEEAQQRHYTRWPIWGINVGTNELPPFAMNYREELDSLKATIGRRLIWLDANIPGHCASSTTTPIVKSDTITKVFTCLTCTATVCTSIEDSELPIGPGSITYSTCDIPVGYSAEFSNTNGCLTFTPSLIHPTADTVMTCLIACKLGICDTTFIILIPPPIHIIPSLEAGVSLYPTPTSTVLYMQATNTFIANIQIMDISGRVIYSNSDMDSNNFRKEINTSTWHSGIYFATVTTDEYRVTYKIIKE